MPLDRSGGQGVADALGFLRRIREDPELAARAEALDPDEGLEPVVALAAAARFDLSAEDLRRAHRIDWQLRRARYS